MHVKFVKQPHLTPNFLSKYRISLVGHNISMLKPHNPIPSYWTMHIHPSSIVSGDKALEETVQSYRHLGDWKYQAQEQL